MNDAAANTETPRPVHASSNGRAVRSSGVRLPATDIHAAADLFRVI